MMPEGSERDRERARREAADWFARLRAGGPAGARSDFEAWRAADPANAAAYDRLVQRWEQAALLRHTATGRARHLPERSPWFAFASTRPAFASLAAALVLLVAITVLVSRPEATGPTLHATRIGEIRSVRLSDGTTVTLDTASSFALAFGSNERRVRLTRGRARFDVAKAPGRPFVVETDAGVVIARGTVFDVMSRGGRMDVLLLHGVVEVRAQRAAEARPSSFAARLRPGQMLAVGATVERDAKPEPAPPAQTEWVSGLLAFDGARLDEVLVDTNRYTQQKVRLAEPALGELRVTGAFRPAPANQLADRLATAFGLEATVVASGDIVLVSADPNEQSNDGR